MMRTLIASAAIAGVLTAPALAGGMAEPVMEPEIIVEESTGTGSGWVVPLILIAIIAAVASSSGSDAPVPVID
jgi:hypothetical protein